ncbi:MAG: hypothetical protein D6723_03340 [Acidobacteria bacterium]|nr:MAG: hypothetical protein D6723_03340 [Acidobacteriota bacterium]
MIRLFRTRREEEMKPSLMELACRRCPHCLWCHQDEAFWQRFETLAPARRYSRGCFVAFEGDSPSGIWVLCRGRAELICGSEHREVLIRLCGPGETLGHTGLFSGQPYDVSVRCVEDCWVRFLAKEDLLKLLPAGHPLVLPLLTLLSAELHEARARVRMFGLRWSPASHLAWHLLRQGGMAASRNNPYRIALTIRQLARLTGFSPRTVQKYLAVFRREGVVGREDQTLWVKDPARLRQYLESFA